MNVRHLLKDTVTIQSPTGASSGGDPVYGDAQHTIKARVEKKIRRVPSAQGWANISVDALVTDTEIKTNDLLWLPGADTTKRAEARRLGTVRTSTTFGGYRTYEVDL